MGDHDDGLAMIAVQFLQQAQDLVGRGAVEITGRLVTEQQLRVGNDGPGNCDALLLTAGELPRIVRGALCQPDNLQGKLSTLAAFAATEVGQQQRQLDVLACGQYRQQVVELEDKADVRRAPVRQLPVRHAGEFDTADFDAAGRRFVETAQQVQQRGLAGTRRPHQGKKLAIGNVEVQFVQYVDAFFAFLVNAADTFKTCENFSHC